MFLQRKPGEVRPAWFNNEVDTSRADRVVVVWTRFHNTETEFQRGMRELPKNNGPERRGIALYHSTSLSRIEGGRWQRGGYRENDDV